MAGRNRRPRRRSAPQRPAARGAAPTPDGGDSRPDGGAAAEATPQSPVTRLQRRDALAAGAVALAAGACFLTTFSTHVALGDAPESVAGVKSVGVLHAPGYPSYVAVATAFTRVFAIGGFAARVNAFSLVCAALMIGAVFLLARNYGATVAGAALGALMLASSASFWFNADFAKHYVFSGLLVALAALAVAHWQSGAGPVWLIVAGALLGACAGASWELAIIMAAGLALLVVFGTRRAPVALLAGAVGTVALLTVAGYAFLMWRARQLPAVNWGGVTNFNRLVEQVTQRDFRSSGAAGTQGSAASKFTSRLPTLLAIVIRDLGLGGFALVLAGAVFGTRKLDRGRVLFLAVTAGLNLFAVVFVTGIEQIQGFLTVIVGGGFLLDLLIVVAVLAALGFEPLVQHGSMLAVRARTPARLRFGPSYDTSRFRSEVAIALFVIVLVPSLVFHYPHADHRQPPYADIYAHRVFSQLPPHAALVLFQNDLTFPLVYRQTVFGDRPDVDLIVVTSLQLAWYREQLARTLHLPSVLHSGSTERQTLTLINELRRTRPVFIDPTLMLFYRDVPYQLRGLLGEVVDPAANGKIDRSAVADTLLAQDEADRIAGHPDPNFPNGFVVYSYARAHIELAKQFARAGQLEPARTELERAIDDYPLDNNLKLVLRFSRQAGETPAKIATIIEGL